jgi:hypothetical protein
VCWLERVAEQRWPALQKNNTFEKEQADGASFVWQTRITDCGESRETKVFAPLSFQR